MTWTHDKQPVLVHRASRYNMCTSDISEQVWVTNKCLANKCVGLPHARRTLPWNQCALQSRVQSPTSNIQRVHFTSYPIHYPANRDRFIYIVARFISYIENKCYSCLLFVIENIICSYSLLFYTCISSMSFLI